MHSSGVMLPREFVFGLEPTANYHKPLGEYLIKDGRMVVLVSAAATAKNRELLDGRWDKHDTKDSANVARPDRSGQMPVLRFQERILYHTNKIRGREREKGINTKMRVKLAAKLLIIAWTLMKKKEVFDPALPEQAG